MDIDNKIPVINQQFSLQEMDDEYLLYNPSQAKTFYLNSSATLIWRLCDGKSTVKQIINSLEGCYPESIDNISSDVHASLQKLIDNHALSLK